MFCAPLVVVVALLRSFVVFCLRLFCVLKLCEPSVIPYSAANTSAFFKRFLLVTFLIGVAFLIGIAFLIGVAVVWYVIYNVQPSSSCGPFGDVAQGVYAYIIQIIQDGNLYPLKDTGKIMCICPL